MHFLNNKMEDQEASNSATEEAPPAESDTPVVEAQPNPEEAPHEQVPVEKAEEHENVQEGEQEAVTAEVPPTEEVVLVADDGETHQEVQEEVIYTEQPEVILTVEDPEHKPHETVEGEDVENTIEEGDELADSDHEQSPVPATVGEKLSREGSPVEQVPMPVPDSLEPGTPEKSRPGSGADETAPSTRFEHDVGDDEEDEDKNEAEFNREDLIERYHQAIVDREQLQQQNYQLQHKLAEYFRKKKADESRQEYDKNFSDQEPRYLKYMAQLEELRRQDMVERENFKHQIQELKLRCEDKKSKVDEERHKFIEFKKQVAFNALNSRSGRPIPPKDIEQYLAAENKKEVEVINVRLENIKLKNKLKKKEHQLKSKEELAEGLHLIDFEQLKIENQTYNEKIEERNEELLKLRKKITSTVQVLTHLKEKLQYVQAENQVQKRNLREVESEVGQKRDILSRTKQARDALRIDNQRLRQNCGLLGNESLLRDFEERKDEGDDLSNKLEQLKMQHAELTLHCNQVRRKIEQARSVRS